MSKSIRRGIDAYLARTLPRHYWAARGDRVFPDLRTPYIAITLKQLLALVPFLVRYAIARFWLLRRGQRPVIDVFCPRRLRPIYGVSCGALGSGSIGRTFTGAFCKFSLRPGLIEESIVLADQFILSVSSRSTGRVIYCQALSALDNITDDDYDDWITDPSRPKGGYLRSWRFEFPARNITYYALYPRSWTVYKLPQGTPMAGYYLICRQVSPVIPHNYKDSSLPVTTFTWDIVNTNGNNKSGGPGGGSSSTHLLNGTAGGDATGDLCFSITFTFRNGVGDPEIDAGSGPCCSKEFRVDADITRVTATDDSSLPSESSPYSSSTSTVYGVKLKHSIGDAMPCTYALSAAESDAFTLSSCLHFNPSGDGSEIWNPLSRLGYLPAARSTGGATMSSNGTAASNLYKRHSVNGIGSPGSDTGGPHEMGVALCATTTRGIPGGSSASVTMALAWDMPTIVFAGARERRYRRRFTRWFPPSPLSGDNDVGGSAVAEALSSYAHSNRARWEREIEAWQNSVLLAEPLSPPGTGHDASYVCDNQNTATAATAPRERQIKLCKPACSGCEQCRLKLVNDCGLQNSLNNTSSPKHISLQHNSATIITNGPTTGSSNTSKTTKNDDTQSSSSVVETGATGLPGWYRAALFNELYFLADGGTVWVEYDPAWRSSESSISDYSAEVFSDVGRFAYLESWEYRMFNTYDVHFYASYALASLWPHIEHSIQTDFVDQVARVDATPVHFYFDNVHGSVKRATAIPHDMGDPYHDPWLHVNAYRMHDIGDWKDLNLKFVLSTYRDYLALENAPGSGRFKQTSQSENSDTFDDGDVKGASRHPILSSSSLSVTGSRASGIGLLKHAWPAVVSLIERAEAEWDPDNDGMIENSNQCDQTYDAWIMSGTSAYCGGLWLAALVSGLEIGRRSGQITPETESRWTSLLERAHSAYERKLWTGEHFAFDESSASSGAIMADQLCGAWALRAMGLNLNTAFDPDHVRTALSTIVANNVTGFAGGTRGAANGIDPATGAPDRHGLQGREVWSGVSYALASHLLAEPGIPRQHAFDTARGLYTSVWGDLGLQFQTPEAIYEKDHFRACGYMRALAIWAIQWMIERGYANKPSVSINVSDEESNETESDTVTTALCM